MKTHRYILLSILIILTTGLTACQTPKEIAFEKICHPANNHERVMTDGYFSLGATVYCSDISGEQRCGLVFNRYPDGEFEFSAEVLEGNRRNQMQPLQSGYLEQDLRIKTSDGSFVGVGERVIISGKLLATESECLMYVDKIESFNN